MGVSIKRLSFLLCIYEKFLTSSAKKSKLLTGLLTGLLFYSESNKVKKRGDYENQ